MQQSTYEYLHCHPFYFSSPIEVAPLLVLRQSLSTAVESYEREGHWDGIGGENTPGDLSHHVFFSSVPHVPQGYVTGMLLHFPLL